MKTALCLIIAMSLLWMLTLALELPTAHGHLLVDRVLPARVVSLTTAEESAKIAGRLGELGRTSSISWVPPVCILLLASYALFAATKKHS